MPRKLADGHPNEHPGTLVGPRNVPDGPWVILTAPGHISCVSILHLIVYSYKILPCVLFESVIFVTCLCIRMSGFSTHPLRSSLSVADFFKGVPVPRSDESSAATKSESPACSVISIPLQDVNLKSPEKQNVDDSKCAGRARDTILSAMKKYNNSVLRVPSIASFLCYRFMQTRKHSSYLHSMGSERRTPNSCVLCPARNRRDELYTAAGVGFSFPACSQTKV